VIAGFPNDISSELKFESIKEIEGAEEIQVKSGDSKSGECGVPRFLPEALAPRVRPFLFLLSPSLGFKTIEGFSKAPSIP
jgi:hypothetical protein